MKRTLSLAITFAAILMLVGCGDDVILDTPDVDYVVAGSGATLDLDWVEIADADGYYIYADGVVIDTIDDATTITYTATTPAAVYGVAAYSGDDVSGTDEVDCTPVETASITVYGNSDPEPTHHSGIGFTTSGNCVTLAISEPTNHDAIDFYFNDANPTHGPIDIVSPSDHLPAYNDEENTTAASGTDYDGLVIAADFGNYSTQRALGENAVLSFWIDPDHDNWDAENDHFGKMKIESISGSAAPYTVVITVAYQPIAGLLWVVTD